MEDLQWLGELQFFSLLLFTLPCPETPQLALRLFFTVKIKVTQRLRKM